MSTLDTIRAGIRNTTTLRWPGTENLVRVRILAKSEIQAATFAARRLFDDAKIAVDLSTVETFKDEETIQILFRALSDNETGKPLAANIDVFRSQITTDELSELVRLYQLFEQDVSPNMDHMSDEEFSSFLADLKKKPDETVGSISSTPFARRLLRSLVSQLPS